MINLFNEIINVWLKENINLNIVWLFNYRYDKVICLMDLHLQQYNNIIRWLAKYEKFLYFKMYENKTVFLIKLCINRPDGQQK